MPPATTKKKTRATKSKSEPETKRQYKGDGSIDPDQLYTIENLKSSTGMGNASIRLARRSGLKLLYLGNRVFVRGKDFIEYVESIAKTQHPSGR